MSDGSLAESFMSAVNAAGDSITAMDSALVDLGIRYALQIDAGIDAGGQAATKALYLGPHLVNLCREMGLTPAARNGGVANTADASKPVATQDELASMRRRHRGGA